MKRFQLSSGDEVIGETDLETALDEYFRRQAQLRLAIRNRVGRLCESNWINVVDFDDGTDDLRVEVAANEAFD